MAKQATSANEQTEAYIIEQIVKRGERKDVINRRIGMLMERSGCYGDDLLLNSIKKGAKK